MIAYSRGLVVLSMLVRLVLGSGTAAGGQTFSGGFATGDGNETSDDRWARLSRQ